MLITLTYMYIIILKYIWLNLNVKVGFANFFDTIKILKLSYRLDIESLIHFTLINKKFLNTKKKKILFLLNYI